MQAAAAAPPARVPPPPRRHRVYTAIDPRCEWARTDDADTLVVDVSGFRKEELKVLYNTSRKLKIVGEHQDVGSGGARWERFLKSFPVPRSVDTGTIRAIMDQDEAVLYVVLPKGSPSLPPPPPPPPPPPSSSMDKHKEQQPESSMSLPHGEQEEGRGSAGGSSGSSNGSFWSAQEDAGKKKIEESSMEPEEAKEKRQEEEIATQDVPRTDGGDDTNAVNKDGDDGDGKNMRWWQKIRPLHVLSLALLLALVGVGSWILCVMLL